MAAESWDRRLDGNDGRCYDPLNQTSYQNLKLIDLT